MCPFVPLEYPLPIEIGIDEGLNDFNLDAIFLPDLWSFKAQEDDHIFKQSESPPSTSSTDHHVGVGAGVGVGVGEAMMNKKISHNASERDRRKKINSLYSSLRALLPSTGDVKKLSIPTTVARVLKYIPELQKEVKDLTRRKEELLSSETLAFRHRNSGDLIQEEIKPKIGTFQEKSSSILASVNKLSDREMVIQISSFERISLSDVLLMLEMDGYTIVDVSSFQSFGGRAFCSIHLWMEEMNVASYGKLNEDRLKFLLQKPKQVCI